MTGIKTTAILHSKNPEELELDEKLAELARLEQELAQCELELATLKAELQAFEHKYLRIIGVRLAKLDEIQAQISELTAKMHPENKETVQTAKNARSQADGSAHTTKDTEKYNNKHEAFIPTNNLKSLYREAARRFHPDLSINEQDRQIRSIKMVEANAAYASGDEETLIKMIHEWKSSPESIIGEDIGAKLIRAIRKISIIKRRLAEIVSEFNLLEKCDLFVLYKTVEDAEAHGNDLLQDMADNLDTEIISKQTQQSKLAITYSDQLERIKEYER